MTRADEQLQRLLIAFPTMADEHKLTFEELAALVGTDAKTLRADFHALDRDDTPAGFVEGVQLFVGSNSVSMRSSHFKRPMRLTRPEVASLELGLGILEQELPVDERHHVTNVRARLRELAVRSVDTVVETWNAQPCTTARNPGYERLRVRLVAASDYDSTPGPHSARDFAA